jgi:hypothetical protein
VANVLQSSYLGWIFGSFEGVQKKQFSTTHQGRFREAAGTPPFTRVYQYEGAETFSGDQAFLVHPDEGVAIPMQPFIFWDECERHPSESSGHCYLFDRAERGDDEFLFKAVGYPCTLDVARDDRYSGLRIQLDAWRTGKVDVARVAFSKLKALEFD